MTDHVNEPMRSGISTPKRNDTLRLTQQFNEKYFSEIRKNIEIDVFSVIRNDIKNYRTLTDEQFAQIETMTDSEKIEIIRIYNDMFSTLESGMNLPNQTK